MSYLSKSKYLQIELYSLGQLILAGAKRTFNENNILRAPEGARDPITGQSIAGRFIEKGQSYTFAPESDLLIQEYDQKPETVNKLLSDKAFSDSIGLSKSTDVGSIIKKVMDKQEGNFVQNILGNLSSDLTFPSLGGVQGFLQGISEWENPLQGNFEKALVDFQVQKEKFLQSDDYQNITKNLGKFVKASLPVAGAVALCIAPELLFPMLVGSSIQWGAVLTSAALGTVINYATEKGLDALKVENQWVRFGASILTGFMAGSVINAFRKGNVYKKILEDGKDEGAKINGFFNNFLKDIKNNQDIKLLKLQELNKKKILQQVKQQNNRQLKEILGPRPKLNLKTDKEFFKESEEIYNKVRQDTVKFYKSFEKNPKTKVTIDGHTELVQGKGIYEYRVNNKPVLDANGNPIKLTKGEYKAIQKFTLSAKDPLNNVLRGIHGRSPDELKSLPHLQEYYQQLTSALNKIPRFQPKEPLSRLMTFHKKEDMNNFLRTVIDKDGIMQDKGFITFETRARGGLSFSDEIHKISLNWMSFLGKEKPTPHTLKILVKPSEKSKGRYISPVSISNQYHQLEEVLFKPDTKFKVVDIQKRTIPALTTKFSRPQRLTEIKQIQAGREKIVRLQNLLASNRLTIERGIKNKTLPKNALDELELANKQIQDSINQLSASIKKIDTGDVAQNVDFARKPMGLMNPWSSPRLYGDTGLRYELELRRWSRDPLTNDGTVQNVEKTTKFMHERFARVDTSKGGRATILILEEIDD